MHCFVEKEKYTKELNHYIASLDVDHKRIFDNLRIQIWDRREKEIFKGSTMYHQYNTNPNMIEPYRLMVYHIDKEIMTAEKCDAEQMKMTQHNYFVFLRNEMFSILSKQISDIVKDMGPEIYMLILNIIKVDRDVVKQCSLVSKRFLQLLNTVNVVVNYNTTIYCGKGCGHKIYIDANTIYYYSCINKKEYKKRTLNGINVECSICLGAYTRLTPDHNIHKMLAWNKCSICETLFIDGMFVGNILKCKSCRPGYKRYNNNGVTITNNQFKWGKKILTLIHGDRYLNEMDSCGNFYI